MWFLLPEDRLRSVIRGNHFLRVIGKLKPGVSIGHAQAEMNTIAARLRQSYPAENGSIGIGCTVIGLQEQIVGEARRALLVLFGAVACVLLVACANVANLLLVRAAGRGQEIALRMALGASRWRVVRSLLTESMLLALIGGAIGLAGTYWLVRAFVALDPIQLPRVHEIAVDRGVMLFASLAAILTGVLFGLWPALRASRLDLNKALKEGSKSNAAGRRGWDLRHYQLLGHSAQT
jgi:putative ABC transport system permease protein